jgi:hypothetical protein
MVGSGAIEVVSSALPARTAGNLTKASTKITDVPAQIRIKHALITSLERHR